MPVTEFFISASNVSQVPTSLHSYARYCGGEGAVLEGIERDGLRTTLVLLVMESPSTGRDLCKSMFIAFGEKMNATGEAHTKLRVFMMNSLPSDPLLYECDRLGDVGAVLDTDEPMKSVAMSATTIRPEGNSFQFSDARLALTLCRLSDCRAEELLALTDATAASLGWQFATVCIYISLNITPKGERDKLTRAVEAFKRKCDVGRFGRDVRVSPPHRLEDVRSWSQLMLSCHQFSPAAVGPYFINLSPHLSVGERLAHAISPGITFLVGDASTAGPADMVAHPPPTVERPHRGVYSPHCRIEREEMKVWITPEYGMTYVNGRLLTEKTLLHLDDRVVLGTQFAFRFVIITDKPTSIHHPNIIDWETTCKEFSAASRSTLRAGERNQLETEVADLRARCAVLESQLAESRETVWLALNSAPSTYSGKRRWPIDLRHGYAQVTVGPQGGICLPFLSQTATIKREKEGLVCLCGSTRTKLTHQTTLTISGSSFTVSMLSRSATACVPAMSLGKSRTATMEEARGSLCTNLTDLQWAVASLFDFAFPPSLGAEPAPDVYAKERKRLFDMSLLEADPITVEDIIRLNERLIHAVRQIGSGLPKGSCAAEMKRSTTAGGQAAVQKEATQESKVNRPPPREPKRKEGHQSKPLAERPVDGPVSVSKLQLLFPVPRRHRGDVEVPVGILTGMIRLRGTCFVATPAVARRALEVISLLSLSGNPRLLLEKYMAALDIMMEPSESLAIWAPTKCQMVHLALVDVLMAMDHCIRTGTITSEDIGSMEQKLGLWQQTAEQCMEMLSETARRSRDPSRTATARSMSLKSSWRRGGASTHREVYRPRSATPPGSHRISRSPPTQSIDTALQRCKVASRGAPSHLAGSEAETPRSCTVHSLFPAAPTPSPLSSPQADATTTSATKRTNTGGKNNPSAIAIPAPPASASAVSGTPKPTVNASTTGSTKVPRKRKIK